MKKFLSLVLALVMTMSLVTVSAGAKDFTDSSKIQYAEAVDVMSAAKVIDGYTDGTFNPTATLTRGAAAKIICNLILGPTTASALVADAAPYKDVPTNHTFAGYIAYCQKAGIISGYADGTFRPANSLTGYAFMKMLLGALGYDSAKEGYTGPNWSINVAKRALNIGLDDDLVGDFNGVKAVNREEACLYALNTLTATMVEYEKNSTVTVGNITIKDQSSAKDMANTGKTDGKIFKADGKMQFAEKYFDNLSVTKGSDDFARPANVWKLKAEKIGTYADTADLTYTKSVDVCDIYKDLGLGSKIEKKDVSVYVDGVVDPENKIVPVAITKDNDDDSYGANGVLTEVFYDDDADTVTITEVNTYVGEISKTVKATSKKDAYVVVIPEGVKPTSMKNSEEFETTASFDDDAYVLYTYSEDAKEIKSVEVAKSVSGEATRIENKAKVWDANKAIYIENTAYKFSNKADGVKLDDASVGNEYDVYLDAYGYAIYVEEVEEIGNYALLVDYQNKTNFNSNKAMLVFADGTEKVVETAKDYKGNSNKLELGTIVTYKEDNGVYTLKPVAKTIATGTFGTANSGLYEGTSEPKNTTNSGANAGDFNLTSDKAGVQMTANKFYTIDKTGSKSVAASDTTGTKNVQTNSKTIFVVYNIDDDDYTVYTGIKNAPKIASTATKNVSAYAYVKGGMTKVMFIYADDSSIISDSNKKMVFLANESVSNLIHTKNSDYYTFNAVINGEIKEVMVDWNVEVNGKTLASADVKSLNGLFESYSVDKYGVITRLTSYSTDAYNNTDAKQVFNNTPKIEGVDSSNNTVTAVAAKSTIGIDKKSADYTVLVKYDDTTKDFKHTITVDDNAKVYAVDEDGNITESSYKAITKDTNDMVYAVIEDYLVKALVIEDVDDGKAPEVTEGNGTFDVTVSKNQAGALGLSYSNYVVEGYPNFSTAWEGTKGKVTVTLVVDGETFTQTTSYKGTQTVQYMLDNAKIPSITLDLASGGVKVKATVTVTFDGMNNDTYKLVGTSGLSILG